MYKKYKVLQINLKLLLILSLVYFPATEEVLCLVFDLFLTMGNSIDSQTMPCMLPLLRHKGDTHAHTL